MGILRPENSRYNAHFVFYKPIKISLIKLVALSRFFFEDLLLAYLPPRLTQAILIYIACVRARARHIEKIQNILQRIA